MPLSLSYCVCVCVCVSGSVCAWHMQFSQQINRLMNPFPSHWVVVRRTDCGPINKWKAGAVDAIGCFLGRIVASSMQCDALYTLLATCGRPWATDREHPGQEHWIALVSQFSLAFQCKFLVLFNFEFRSMRVANLHLNCIPPATGKK